MDKYEQICKLNLQYDILPITDSSFIKYGKIYDDLDLNDAKKALVDLKMPQTGAKYEASVSALEDLKLSKNIKNNIYGGYPIDVGLTWGHTNKFVAFEYHQCSELNIALDDVVMVFSKRQILERNHQIDFDKDVQMYYVPKNTAVELYNDTLHYSPLEITKDGYRVIVVVTHDTNKSFASDFKTDNPRLIAQAKFVVAHSDATDEIKLGAPVKIIGHPIELTSIS